jgi:dephospho-CoA kinase
MLVIGLTGSLAMGKSTVAKMFAEAGAAVFDADATVHALYRGAAAPAIDAAFPGTVTGGVVDRGRLADKVVGDRDALARLEAIVHPLVRAAEERFLAEAVAGGRRLAVLDIPLLLETGEDARVHAVVVVSTSPEIQHQRIMERLGPAKAKAKAAALAARQMSDADKRARAHFVIDTSGPFEATRAQVLGVVRSLAPAKAGS